MLTLGQEQLDALREGLRESRIDTFLWELLARQIDAEERESVLVASEPRGRTRLRFDEATRPSRLTLPSGRSYRFVYDDGDHIVRLEAGEQHLDVGRDVSGRMTSVHGMHGLVIELGYDVQDRITAIRRSDGPDHHYDYDRDGGVKSRSIGNDVLTYRRGLEGELQAIESSQHSVTQFERRADRLHAATFPDRSMATFQMDGSLRRATLTRRDGSRVQHRLSSAGSIERVDWADGRFLEIDWQGDHPVALHTAEAWVTLSWAPNGAVELEASASGATRIAHDDRGHLSQLTLSNGDTVTYRYDERERLVEIAAWGLSHRIRRRKQTVERDFGDGLIETQRLAGGRIAHATLRHGARTLAEEIYSYDDRARLLRIETLGQGDPRIERVTYDDITRRVVGIQDQTAVVQDALGRLVSIPAELPAAQSPLRCTFNHDGTLARVEGAGATSEYTYDGFGRRVEKRVGKRHWRYGWSRHQLLFEERDGPRGPIRRDYLYEPHAATPLGFRESGHVFWMQRDCRGAVVRVFRSDGTLGWRARYDVRGKAHIEVERLEQPFRLDGHYEDAETGLHYAIGRYFSPTCGMYLTPLSGIAPTADRYAYADGDPFNRRDIVGLTPTAVASSERHFDPLAALGEIERELTGGEPLLKAAEGGFANLSPFAKALVGMGTGETGAAASLLLARLAREAVTGDPIRMLETQPARNALFQVVRRILRERPGPFSEVRRRAHAMRFWAS